MKSIGEKLRAARIQREISLDDVASATRINKAFLEQIETGIRPDLPATYLRVFVRSFAQQVGLDAAELLREMESGTVPSTPSPAPRMVATQTTRPVTSTDVQSAMQGGASKRHPLRLLIVLLFLLGGALILTISWLRNERQSKPVQEISFSDVVQEQEDRLNSPSGSTNPRGSMEGRRHIAATPESLRLTATTTDSVWMKIIIDGSEEEEYSLPPNYTLRWHAKNGFVLTLGNAGGIEFTLNGIKMGSLGQLRKPLKNVSVNHETLKKLQIASESRDEVR